jgi:MHS family proline/betaine transporter-like MFS transporter
MLPVSSAEQSSGTRQDSPKHFSTVVAASLVTGLEMFDLTVFGFFAVVIGEQFFPAKDPLTSLLWSVGTFGIGFFMRPLGALMIGAYADRKGRRAALTRTCWMMAVGTAALGLCPPFADIGVAAPLIVLAGRLLQGFAVGGDIGVAAAFVMETSPVSRRGYRVSWQLSSQGAAALMGATSGLLLTSMLPPAALSAWGWRIPFLVGLPIAPVGLYLRCRLPDATPHTRTTRSASGPVAELFRQHRATIALAMLMGQTIPVYVIVYYMPSYATRIMHMPARTGYLASALSALVLVVIPPLAGGLIDRLPRRKPLALTASACMICLIYPVFLIIGHATSTLAILCGVALISVMVALSAVTGTLLVLEAFPSRVRATGMAVSHALHVAVFGGTAQFIVTGLIKLTGNPMSAAWYVTLACVVNFCALVRFREQRSSADT